MCLTAGPESGSRYFCGQGAFDGLLTATPTGKLQRQELQLGHLHVHLGSVQHKVSKLKSGRRFSLIIQYEWISTAGMETAAAAGVQARNGAFQPRLGQGEGGGKVQIATYDTMGEAEASPRSARHSAMMDDL